MQRPGDRADAAVAEVEQIVRRLPPGRDIVDGDRIGLVVGHRAPEQHGRHRLAVGIELQMARRIADRHQHRPSQESMLTRLRMRCSASGFSSLLNTTSE